MFISWDINIYDRANATGPKVQSSTLNEDLGQIKFIFSDKTGTLTKNYMEFSKMNIGKYEYGLDSPEKEYDFPAKDKYGLISNFKFYDSSFNAHFHNQTHENYSNIHTYLKCISLCHTVINNPNKKPETGEINNNSNNNNSNNIPDDHEINYQSSSPDELAIVNAARVFGYTFLKRDIDNNIYIAVQKEVLKFKILNILEYSSER